MAKRMENMKIHVQNRKNFLRQKKFGFMKIRNHKFWEKGHNFG